MPQLAPLSWLFLSIFFWFLLLVICCSFWWFSFFPVKSQGASFSFGEDSVWSW